MSGAAGLIAKTAIISGPPFRTSARGYALGLHALFTERWVLGAGNR
jgi:hypothetical protein